MSRGALIGSTAELVVEVTAVGVMLLAVVVVAPASSSHAPTPSGPSSAKNSGAAALAATCVPLTEESDVTKEEHTAPAVWTGGTPSSPLPPLHMLPCGEAATPHTRWLAADCPITREEEEEIGGAVVTCTLGAC